MPRSDDWTIHMPPSLIKRRGGPRLSRMTRPNSPQPGFASLCLASLIHGRMALGRPPNEGFDVDVCCTIFFAGGRGDWRVGLPLPGVQGQAVEIFVELT